MPFLFVRRSLVAGQAKARDRSVMSSRNYMGVVVVVLGCARSHALVFQGHTSEPNVAPENVLETSVMPRNASWLGRIAARCQSFTPTESFEDRALFDLDCSEQRLRSLLREGAASAGGNVLSEVVCSAGSTRECRALVSRVHVERSLESTPIDPTLRSTVGDARVSFWAEGKLPAPRPAALVSEQPVSVPNHEALGCVRVWCESCSELDARDALRVAAARLGASDVVSPHCATIESRLECMAELARTERND
jgi:hypothetical protein